MSYESLDRIADSYIPFLSLIALGSIIFPVNFSKSVFLRISVNFLFLIGLVLLVYILMYIDSCFGVFTYFGLDYSTHTALSMVLSCFLSWCHRKYWVYFIGVFLIYLMLMLYQAYHTVEDIVFTIAVVSPLVLLLFWLRVKEKIS